MLINKYGWAFQKDLVQKIARVTTRDDTTQDDCNMKQHDTTRVLHETTRGTRVQHETARVQYDTTRVQHDPTRVQRKLWQQKQGSTLLFLLLNYIFSQFLSEIVNIVQHVILFQAFEYQGLIILPSKILSNQAHMALCAKLSNLLYIKLKIAIQVTNTYIYPLFCVLFG